MIAALFVDENGPYANDSRFDAYGVTRDARTYKGSAPAVVHSPCKRWGRYAWGTPANQIEMLADDGAAFHCGLVVTRSNGGVMEHPAGSVAWEWFNLPVPPEKGWSQPDAFGGRSCRIDQSSYGHPCQKPTWLYAVLPVYPTLDWSVTPTEKKVESLGSKDPWRWQTPDQLKEALHDMAASCIGWTPKRGQRQARLNQDSTGGSKA